MNSADFLVEIGTEELPPKSLRTLMNAFRDALEDGVDEARLAHAEVRAYASPRRLAVHILDLAVQQEDRKLEKKGPPVKVAFDSDGNATPAANAFAKKCGVAVSALGTSASEKGEWLSFTSVEIGKTVAELLPELIESALSALPIPRRMRWGAGNAEFVRPVHWVVLLHGESVIKKPVMGIQAGNTTRGHRFHSREEIEIQSPAHYLDTLFEQGFVVADFERRREQIVVGVGAAAGDAGGQVVGGEGLYDEVTSLVEWPVAVLGRFDEKYLRLPREVIVSTLTSHQRYFPIADSDGNLLPRFITVANIASKDPDQVRDGNERVVRPRLADAVFFWDSDRQQTLASREEELGDVVYQRGLGSVFDKSARVANIARWLATALDHKTDEIERAARLAKCDLVTGMVVEFPELQGTMGRYYAIEDKESEAVCDAIGQHYLPRFAGDTLPASVGGQILSVADKLDTLAGIFSIGKKPSGNRDPFGLRRAALGIVRILIESGLDVELSVLIDAAVKEQPVGKLDPSGVAADLHDFISDRLRRYFLDRDTGLTTAAFDAVSAREPTSLLDFDRRLAAVQTFARLEQSTSLASANKRIANILRQAGKPDDTRVNKRLLSDAAEIALFNALQNAEEKVAPKLALRNYADVLNQLADLRDPVDRFFDEVMVMSDDEEIRANRLALLGQLQALFLNVADISRLSIS